MSGARKPRGRQWQVLRHSCCEELCRSRPQGLTAGPSRRRVPTSRFNRPCRCSRRDPQVRLPLKAPCRFDQIPPNVCMKTTGLSLQVAPRPPEGIAGVDHLTCRRGEAPDRRSSLKPPKLTRPYWRKQLRRYMCRFVRPRRTSSASPCDHLGVLLRGWWLHGRPIRRLARCQPLVSIRSEHPTSGAHGLEFDGNPISALEWMHGRNGECSRRDGICRCGRAMCTSGHGESANPAHRWM